MTIDITNLGQEAWFYFIYPKGKENIFSLNFILLGLQVALVLITLVTIFLYKRRILQIRLVAFASLICVFYFGYIFLFGADVAAKDIPVGLVLTGTSYGLAAYFPIAQIFLLYLAQKSIKKDEILVRSSDRLR
jgi:hypothetical protein